MDDADTDDDEPDDGSPLTPDFSSTLNHHYHLHTHAPVDNIIYNLGSRALEGEGYTKRSLNTTAASLWNKFTHRKVQRVLSQTAPALKIWIPARLPLVND